jgi:hypothetical protein
MVNYMQPGRRAKFPKNLLNTWIDYRISTDGTSLADLIKEVNGKLEKNYSNHSFWTWKTSKIPTPVLIIREIIYPELASILHWYFTTNGVASVDSNFDQLAQFITSPNSPDTLKLMLDFIGITSQRLDFNDLSASITP